MFFRVILPVLALVNLALGLFLLSMLRPHGWVDWLVALTAGFCCLVGGWLGASGWSRSYWGQVMAIQVGTWHRIADAILEWLEELRIPPDKLDRLRRRLEELGG